MLDQCGLFSALLPAPLFASPCIRGRSLHRMGTLFLSCFDIANGKSKVWQRSAGRPLRTVTTSDSLAGLKEVQQKLEAF